VDLSKYSDKKTWFTGRAAIRKILRKKITTQNSDHWIQLLRAKGMWCEKVLNYNDLNSKPFMNDLQLKQIVENSAGETMVTTRSPIKIDGDILSSSKAAPKVGEDNKKIHKQFLNS
jgi:CoA:oxalate CoA-transferase